ncbi:MULTISPECIES: EamA family transporter [Pseudomonas]|jgi:O-acetylserine/cysteine efflux transporter|uniref:O-acetylserine/cysteine efflux transporter n=1 Tax=Pseudomonas putida TaxID=303 RepID=A0A9X8EJ93_PSEPU|nr:MULTISPECIES: EamA family transporter [Pseudomonas]KTC22607.1 acetylserine transporter [Pseudomonas putida]MBG8559601.1 EamA family transporter [Pseudomonas qingdaonensis]MCP8350584.1 O-acetylserine/cysteine exporter [Pseudomonas sp. FBF18]MCQ0167004.1 O-acetylserine/cysteine exporter [Pseudomonas sp. S12(2018)]MDD1955514.1 EamA family transporter [Pseudomonas sp. 8209]
MPLKDLLLALVVIVAWGLNFVVIKVGLDGLPPMLLGGLRFVLVLFPAIFFIKRPQLPWRWLLAYGTTISLGQFAFLFEAMGNGMPPGLASLVLQSQAFFTLFFAAMFLGERLRAASLLGLLVAAGGLALIGSENGSHVPFLALVLTLCAAACWAMGNIITRRFGNIDLVALVIWGALIPPLPFFALSWWLEGPALIESSLRGIGLNSILALAYLAFIATMLGYSLWSGLLSRYPAGKVAPFSLLVPVVGLSSSALLLGERLSTLQCWGGVLVMVGLLINVFGSRLRQRLRAALS